MTESFTPVLTDQSYRGFNLTGTPAGYTQTANAGQRFSVTMPAKPPGAYPYRSGKREDNYPGAVIVYESSSFTTSTDSHVKASPDPITSSSDFRYQLLLNGFVVITVQVTAVSGESELNAYGDGMFHAPGGVERRWERWANPNQIKDGVVAFQYLRAHRERIIRELKAAGSIAYGWDDNWCVAGTSSAAAVASAVALRPDRSYELGTEGPATMRTVPNCAVLNATNVGIPWAFQSSATWLNLLPTGETNNTPATTIALAAQRYVYEVGSWLDMPGRRNNTLPHIFAWSDQNAGIITTLLGNLMAYLGEPFVDSNDALIQQWDPAVSHLISTFLAFQSAYPDRFHLSVKPGVSDATSQKLGIHTDAGGRIYRFDENAYQPSGERGSIVDFVDEHITDRPWDMVRANLQDGIRRRGQVEAVGGMRIPPHPLRESTFICNTSADTAGGVAASDEKLIVGFGPHITHAVLAPGESIEMPGSAPIWLRSSTDGALNQDVARFGAVEKFPRLAI